MKLSTDGSKSVINWIIANNAECKANPSDCHHIVLTYRSLLWRFNQFMPAMLHRSTDTRTSNSRSPDHHTDWADRTTSFSPIECQDDPVVVTSKPAIVTKVLQIMKFWKICKRPKRGLNVRVHVSCEKMIEILQVLRYMVQIRRSICTMYLKTCKI